MKQFKFKINGKSYEVAVEEKERNLAEVHLNGKTLLVEVEKEEPVAHKPAPVKKSPASVAGKRAETPGPKPAGGANAIKAPIPGNILRIEVSVGQPVKKGTVLLVMESMKMENNILANRDGVVKAIPVTVGENVLQGSVLIDLE
jgi:biotin carboxyl carrier protein